MDTEVSIYQGIYWDCTNKKSKKPTINIGHSSSYYDIIIHKYEFDKESVWRRKEQSKTTKRLSFMYTCDTANERNGKQGVIAAIKFLFMLMKKHEISQRSWIGPLWGLLKKKPNEELVAKDLMDDIDKHFCAGFVLHWDDYFNHWMVDYDIIRILK